jgi:hypothetical protein
MFSHKFKRLKPSTRIRQAEVKEDEAYFRLSPVQAFQGFGHRRAVDDVERLVEVLFYRPARRHGVNGIILNKQNRPHFQRKIPVSNSFLKGT